LFFEELRQKRLPQPWERQPHVRSIRTRPTVHVVWSAPNAAPSVLHAPFPHSSVLNTSRRRHSNLATAVHGLCTHCARKSQPPFPLVAASATPAKCPRTRQASAPTSPRKPRSPNPNVTASRPSAWCLWAAPRPWSIANGS